MVIKDKIGKTTCALNVLALHWLVDTLNITSKDDLNRQALHELGSCRGPFGCERTC